MIVRRLADCVGSAREVSGRTWTSRRLLMAGDGMGFSFHDTLIRAGTETRLWYKHHVEAVYCVAGEGEIEDLATGEIHPIAPGTLYALDRHDRHILRARSELRLVCAFNPALAGDETHDADGSYPPPAQAAEAAP